MLFVLVPVVGTNVILFAIKLIVPPLAFIDTLPFANEIGPFCAVKFRLYCPSAELKLAPLLKYSPLPEVMARLASTPELLVMPLI